MSTDIFNNSSNDYIYPALSPCPGVADSQYLEFLDDQEIGILSGGEIISTISFSDLSIPVASFNKEKRVVQGGEVVFIGGLTKGLCARNQGFTMPTTLGSSSLNPYFMEVDLSINYYQNFSYVYTNIEASANYTNNVDIQYALNEQLDGKSIKASATYDPSLLSFSGTENGYEFNVSNVKLTLIDASTNSSSPFDSLIVDGVNIEQSWVLDEDSSENIPYAKYPNTAMQGLILKGIYPDDYVNSTNGYVYVNHVTDYVRIYTQTDISVYDSSTTLMIVFDLSTYIGESYSVSVDASVFDTSCNVDDISVRDVVLFDGSGNITDLDIDSSIIDYKNILDSSVASSTITASYISGFLVDDSSITNSGVSSTPILNSRVVDSSLSDASISISEITNVDSEFGNWRDVSIYRSRVLDTDITSSYAEHSLMLGASTYGTLTSSGLVDSSVRYYVVNSTNLWSSYLRDSSIYGGDSSLNYYDDSSVLNVTERFSTFACSHVEDASIKDCYLGRSRVYDSELFDVSVYTTYVHGARIDASTENRFRDSSILVSTITKSNVLNSMIEDCSITNIETYDTQIKGSNITDSSFGGNTVISEDSSIIDSYMIGCWTNAHVLLVNPSTGQKIFVTEDDSLTVDDPSATVWINTCLIWDSSINNAVIYDSSLYNSYIEDSSLIGCTTYNCSFDSSTSQTGSRDVLIDPSIGCVFDIVDESSTYYRYERKSLDVGKSGTSSPSVMSAGDYLNWVTTNNEWRKVGELYAWTSVPDTTDCTVKNLIDGFYVYNPHSFSVKIEYLVFT